MTGRTFTHVSEDPDRLIATSQIADMLNEFFDLPDDERIAQNTPYMWWYRSRNNHEIAFPMPAADWVTGRSGVPLWKQAKILHWFGQWRGFDVPWCREAGDRTDMKGRRVPSAFRVQS